MPTNTNGELRARPRVNVTRGYPGNESEAITASLPVTEAVLSGQALKRTSANKFELADNTTAATSVYIAYHDSTDTDVTSCGKLLGFAAIGVFEIETAYVDVTLNSGLAVGDALGVDANGSLAKQGGGTGATIGYVTEIRDLGVGGHTGLDYTTGGGNPRGGVPGTIPEDSTAADYLDVNTAQVLEVTIAGTNTGTPKWTVTIDGTKYEQGWDTNIGTTAGALATQIQANAAITTATNVGGVITITAAAAGDAGSFTHALKAEGDDATIAKTDSNGELGLKIVKFVTSV